MQVSHLEKVKSEPIEHRRKFDRDKLEVDGSGILEREAPSVGRVRRLCMTELNLFLYYPYMSFTNTRQRTILN